MGSNPRIRQGDKLGEEGIKEIEKTYGFTFPACLRNFYLEMGKYYCFSPSTDHTGFSISHINDLRYSASFHNAVEEELALELSNSDDISGLEELKNEAKRRSTWFPFYGIGGGGTVLCIDLNTESSPVYLHDSACWTSDDRSFWNFELADSFESFIKNWLQFCFSDPRAEIVRSCETKKGSFDWSPMHFHSEFHPTPKS